MVVLELDMDVVLIVQILVLIIYVQIVTPHRIIEDITIIITDNDLGRVRENRYGIMSYDVDVGHFTHLLVNEK